MNFAAVFPGQGSQSVGMLAALNEDCSVVAETFAEASEILSLDLWKLSQEGPEEALNKTEITQPLMLTAGVATWRAWLYSGGDDVEYMAGHSLGEYSALVCSGAMSFTDAVKLVQQRGRLMQSAVPAGEGAAAAILGLDDETLIKVCAEVAQGEVVSAANFNSPGQVVIAGHRSAVDRAAEAAKAAGAKRAVILPMSVPPHCSLMEPAARELAPLLAAIEFSAPRIPVAHNADVAFHTDADEIRDILVQQLYSPVRWVETVRKLAEEGATHIVEFGPGRVLAGLTKRIDRSLVGLGVDSPEAMEKVLALTEE